MSHILMLNVKRVHDAWRTLRIICSGYFINESKFLYLEKLRKILRTTVKCYILLTYYALNRNMILKYALKSNIICSKHVK